VFGGLVMDEIRLAVQRLRKRPSTTLASIVTLALAIAAAAATWSIITAFAKWGFEQRSAPRALS